MKHNSISICLSQSFWFSFILVHSEGKRLKLTAGTAVVFELNCYVWGRTLGAAVELRGSRTRCIPISLQQLREGETEMSPSLISKRTSFGIFQNHLSTLTAVTSCHTHTAVAPRSVRLCSGWPSGCASTGHKLAKARCIKGSEWWYIYLIRWKDQNQQQIPPAWPNPSYSLLLHFITSNTL